MTKVRDNVRIYGGDASSVWRCAKGATQPTDLTAPSTTTHTELGWLAEGGVDFAQQAEQKKHYAYQGGAMVRVSYGKASRSFKFQCLEETAITLGLAHPGMTFVKSGTGSATVAKGTIPKGISPPEFGWLIDTVDDSSGAATNIVKRWELTGAVNPAMTVQHRFDELTIYEYTVEAVGEVELITNSPGVLAGIP